MKLKISLNILCLFTCLLSFSQDNLHSSLTIDPELKKNANAIVRLNDVTVEILSIDKMIVSTNRVVTVLNSDGASKVNARINYDSSVKIKTLEAKIYNAWGKEIKKIRKKDFLDVSAIDGISLYNDDRIKYLNYTPIRYPYTVAYREVYETSFTVYIPSWFPLDDYYVSVERSTYNIINETSIELSTQIEKFEAFDIVKNSNQSFEANNLLALKRESYSSLFSELVPFARVALKEFNMKGVSGVNSNWNDFGKWMNDELLMGTQKLPESVKQEIKRLTATANNDIDKAKIVYKFMQDKTRYISIQIGIGGWKPMLATDVDRLGYGDCKGLSNYTKALLDEVGVTSYYTVIYGGRNVRDIDSEFSSLQGNHAILALPKDDNYIWLECTNQNVPFGYIANFTDDRNALVITPEGGKIVHTKKYETLDNLQVTEAKVQLKENGDFAAQVSIITKGTQYGLHDYVENKILKDQKLYYKDYWDNINNFELNSMAFDNDKEHVVFKEDVNLKATQYCKIAGDRLLFEPNMFNRFSPAPPRYKARKRSFEMDRGFIDEDDYNIELPDGLQVEALQENVMITNKFGTYKFSITKGSNHNLLFKRTLILNQGKYKKEEYKDFREFWLKILKHDKSKIVLIKKS